MTVSGRGPGFLVMALAVSSFAGCGPSEEQRRLRAIVTERAPHATEAERLRIVEAVVDAQERTSIDPFLLLSMIEEESHFKARAESRRGALGLLQVMPATGRDVAARHGIRLRDETSLFEPRTNVLIGAIYLSELRTRFGSLDLALTAYNRGPTRTKKVAKSGKRPSSRYAGRILRRFERWRSDFDD